MNVRLSNPPEIDNSEDPSFDLSTANLTAGSLMLLFTSKEDSRRRPKQLKMENGDDDSNRRQG